MSKRALSPANSLLGSPSKKICNIKKFSPYKIATPEASAKVDANPPFANLINAIKNGVKSPQKGDAVVHWMRMADLRIADNRALSLASTQAQKTQVPLLVLFVVSPQDYIAHDRSARRIDFTLRNLSCVKSSLRDLDIPLFTTTHTPRRTIPEYIINLLTQWNVTNLYANIEYEVDELRRDVRVCELAKAKGIKCHFVHDKLIVEPGMLSTKQKKPYTVFSPFHRSWIDAVNKHLEWIEEAPTPTANPPSIRDHTTFGAIFTSEVPTVVEGFECSDKDSMAILWPAGNDAAKQILARFLTTKARSTELGPSDLLSSGAQQSDKKARIVMYKTDRDRADSDTTSRLSPYLSAGAISIRELIRATMGLLRSKSVDSSRGHGVGVWVQELGSSWTEYSRKF